MVFKNKKLKTTAAAIAIISIIGTGIVSNTYADTSSSNYGLSIERALNNGVYEI